jgi:hypothetical protein
VSAAAERPSRLKCQRAVRRHNPHVISLADEVGLPNSALHASILH